MGETYSLIKSKGAVHKKSNDKKKFCLVYYSTLRTRFSGEEDVGSKTGEKTCLNNVEKFIHPQPTGLLWIEKKQIIKYCN